MNPRISRRALIAGSLAAAACGRKTQLPRAAAPTLPAPLFRSCAQKAGLHFQQGHDGRLPLNILETIGSGCAFLDFDGDGWLDILLVGQPKCALYQNRRDGTFRDVTAGSGLEAPGHWLGCAVGDIDGDGRPDIYLSGYHCGALYRNTGRGTFRDVTSAAGIRPRGWETSCCFFSAAGRLYLYVGRYVEFSEQSRQYCTDGGRVTACGPLGYPPQFGTLYARTPGHDVEFVDATSEAGFGAQSGKCLAAAAVDLGGDGSSSLYLGNDELAGNFFSTPHGSGFQDLAVPLGIAFDRFGAVQGAMGLDWGDYDNDGRMDLVVATYRAQPASLYRNRGAYFEESAGPLGLAEPTLPYVGFGTRFFDYDNDGFLDLVIANGHVQAGLEAAPGETSSSSYEQPLQLFHNLGGRRFELLDPRVSGAGGPYVGRGLAVGDYDRDGKLDILMINSEGDVVLLNNQCTAAAHWLQLDLEDLGVPGGSEGAVVRLRAGKQRLMRSGTTSGSYLSSQPIRVHFGLGEAAEAAEIDILWPGGARQTIPSLPADRLYRVSSGKRPVEL